MLSTYIQIAQAIKDKVPGIAWFDLDKGQLEKPDAFNSVIVPGVLIGQADIEWSDLVSRNQQGIGTITVKTAFTLPAQTNLLDPLVTENLKVLELADDVDVAVRLTRGIASRTATKEYVAGPFYVVEQTYEGAFQHGPFFQKAPVKPFINPQLHKPIARA